MSAQPPKEIVPGVYELGSDFVNWFLVEEDDALTAVDAGFGGFAKSLESDLQVLGFTAQDIKALVLTHSDADHTGLGPRLQQAGVQVYVHPDDEDTLRKPRPKGGDASVRNLIPRLINSKTWMAMGTMVREGGRPKGVERGEDVRRRRRARRAGGPRGAHRGHSGHYVIFTRARDSRGRGREGARCRPQLAALQSRS